MTAHTVAIREPLIDEISESLFEPHTIAQRHMHENLIMILAAVNILTITATFLVAPAL